MINDKIAILIPCYNEDVSIAKVIKECQKYVAEAVIYVYDNNSTDDTVSQAKKQGVVVRSEQKQGKGNVVRRMFADIDADVYVMIDGDLTYDIKQIPLLVKELKDNKLDMVVGARREMSLDAYRLGHRAGNWFLTKLVQIFFNQKLDDMLSGYRVFSKRFVKCFPAQSTGFEIETELTVFAFSARLPIKEVKTDYFARPEGSVSKLSTYNDGLIILKTIIMLVKDERPMLFFNLFALLFFVLGLIGIIPVLNNYFSTGLVPRFPTVIVITGVFVCSVISFLIGLVLDSIASAKKETRRQNYLRF